MLTKHLRIRCRPEDAELLQRAADLEDRSLSSFVRRAAVQAALMATSEVRAQEEREAAVVHPAGAVVDGVVIGESRGAVEPACGGKGPRFCRKGSSCARHGRCAYVRGREASSDDRPAKGEEGR